MAMTTTWWDGSVPKLAQRTLADLPTPLRVWFLVTGMCLVSTQRDLKREVCWTASQPQSESNLHVGFSPFKMAILYWTLTTSNQNFNPRIVVALAGPEPPVSVATESITHTSIGLYIEEVQDIVQSFQLVTIEDEVAIREDLIVKTGQFTHFNVTGLTPTTKYAFHARGILDESPNVLSFSAESPSTETRK